jgi:zinc protease
MRAGTRARSGSQLEDELARLGATLGTKTESDWSALSLDILRDKLPQGIELLSEIVTTPAFERASVELVRARIIGAIDERQGDSKRLALDHLQALIYGHSALGLPAVGTRKTVERITAAEVAAFYRAYWQPASVSLVVAGDVTPEAAKELLSPAFARWTPPRTAPNARPPVAAVESSRRVVLVDQPAAKQSTVCIGFPTVPRSSPHWPAIEVVNRVLGGAYSSRINLNIREDKGYSYNIRSALAENRGAGELYIRGTIVIDKTVPAVVEVLKELDRLRSQPPTDAELESGKALAIGLATRLETNAQLGDVVTRAIVFGLPLDHLARYVEEVRALTRDQALEAANAYFGAARASIVVLGPAARLRESLSAAGFGPVEKP